jgi:hypothetical protein
MENIPALTVKQPWARLIMLGIKNVENRSWTTDYRGRLFIHAGRSWDGTELSTEQLRQATRQIAPNREDHVYGAIIGTVELTEIVEDSESPWARKSGPSGGRAVHHWLISNPRQLSAPIPWRGQMGLWWPTRFTG